MVAVALMRNYHLVKVPYRWQIGGFNHFFAIIRQITEEIYTGFFFKLVDAAAVLSKIAVGISFMLEQKSDGMILSVFNHQQCTEIVRRHNQTVALGFYYLIL